MSAITVSQVKKSNIESVPISQTDLEIAELTLTAGDTLNFRVDLVVSSVVGTPVVKMQSRPTGGTWEDLGSANASVTLSNGNNTIRLNKETVADLVDLPIRKECRLVITTDGSSSVDVDSITHERR